MTDRGARESEHSPSTEGTVPTAVGSDAQPVQRRTLLVVGQDVSGSFALPDAGTVTLGRSTSCDIRIDHPSVSRHHATLYLSDDIEIEDMSSANGTRVRGERLVAGARVPVRPSEVIDVGSLVIIVQEPSAPLRRRRIWNHELFEERVEEECARAERSGSSFALLRVTALEPSRAAAVERAICDAVGRADVVGRYGPYAWEAMLVDSEEQEVDRIATRIADDAPDIQLGVAVYPRDGHDALSLGDTAVARARADASQDRPRAARLSMPELDRLVERVAEGNISVLILGETGVGKEVLAERIHELSPRRDRPFVRINCAALSETLLESELFGHLKGSFTGANRAKRGLLESADGGTVLLDEVGDLPAPTQVKLLRVLEQREILPVGAVAPRAIDVRFVAATHRELERESQSGAFRQDLYFRLAGITLRVPALRDRTDEIPLLAEMFLREAVAGRSGRPVPSISPEALRLLLRYPWPGNIRELRHVIERAVLLSTGGTIEPADLPIDKLMNDEIVYSQASRSARRPAAPPAPPTRVEAREPDEYDTPTDLQAEVERLERERILRALDDCGGNQTRAAEALGISRSKLISRLDQYGVPRPRKQGR